MTAPYGLSEGTAKIGPMDGPTVKGRYGWRQLAGAAWSRQKTDKWGIEQKQKWGLASFWSALR